MTIDNSDESARISASDPVEAPVAELSSVRATALQEDVDLSSLAVATAVDTSEIAVTHDSVAPTSRKLAPPPKPKRDSGSASRPPSVRPLGDSGLDSALASAALKAPIAPTISYSGELASDGAHEADTASSSSSSSEASEIPVLPPVPTSGAPPLSAPPPIPRRRSNPSFAASESDDAGAPATTRSPSDPAVEARSPSDPALIARSPSDPAVAARSPSDPAVAASEAVSVSGIVAENLLKPSSNSPRPVAAPPRPASNPPPPRPASTPPPAARPPSEPPASAGPPVSAPPSSSAIFAMRIIAVGESHPPPPVQADHSADPTAYPAGLGRRRSSRPAPGAPAAVPESMPPLDSAPDIAEVVDVGVDAAPPLAVSSSPALAPPSEDVTEELSDDDVSPDSGEKKTSPAPDVEELGRDDAISVPPEELAAFQEAQAQAKADGAKPPPPPKRAAGAPPSAPAIEPTVTGASAAVASPTPDPAAARAAQRAKTRQPWWEDLFNEDFMRASARVNDEQVRREVTFIEESLGVAAGGVVLDLGCGAGHHAVEFASRGYGVVGYDLSLYQLALAADVAQERSQKINFLQGDMREMAFEEMFDGVFCWNTTFGYFEEDKNLAVAQRVFKALRPGGMFLIDVLNRDFAAASAPQQVWYEGDSCVCMDDMSVDYISSRLRVKRSIILDDGRTKESLFSLRLYSLHELGKLLHEVGFRVTEASGHPSTPGVFFGPNSPRIIMLAQRP
jgi:SAM-dependent methyltransferase